MDEKKLEAFARKAARGLKTDKDLTEFCQMLTKITIEPPSMPNLTNIRATNGISLQTILTAAMVLHY